MAQIPSQLLSHSQKVCRLYKKVLRNLESYSLDKLEFREFAVEARAKFDESKDIKDVRVAKKIYLDGEEWLFKCEHHVPRKFPFSLGGCSYQRDVIMPDWTLDYWDYWEKAFYPKYFARREKAKKDYIEFYKKMYGEPEKWKDH